MTDMPPLDRLVPDYIKRFEAYIPSKPDEELKKLYGCSRLYRLNNNENPLGPPPAAQQVLGRFPPPRAAVYPSGDAFYLRQKLAARFGLHPDQLIVGNGANEAIAFVIKAFCQEGDNIITADRTFAVYEWVAEFSGFEARLVPLLDYGFDDEGMLRRVDDRTKILFVCNPNNPTGTYWSRERLRRFLDVIQGRQIVVLDEAYAEFVDQEAALAAGDDDEHVLLTRVLVSQGKEYLKKELDLLHLPFRVGEGNIIMIKLPMSDTLAYRRLMTRGVMVRTMTGFRFPNWIRVTIHPMEAMEALVEGLKEIIKK